MLRRQSTYFLPGLTSTYASDVVPDSIFSSVNEPSSSRGSVFDDALDLEDVPLAVLADHKRVRRVRRKKKTAEIFKMSREGRSNPFPKNSFDEGGWIFREEMMQQVPWVKVVATGPEHPLHNRHQFVLLDLT